MAKRNKKGAARKSQKIQKNPEEIAQLEQERLQAQEKVLQEEADKLNWQCPVEFTEDERRAMLGVARAFIGFENLSELHNEKADSAIRKVIKYLAANEEVTSGPDLCFLMRKLRYDHLKVHMGEMKDSGFKDEDFVKETAKYLLEYVDKDRATKVAEYCAFLDKIPIGDITKIACTKQQMDHIRDAIFVPLQLEEKRRIKNTGEDKATGDNVVAKLQEALVPLGDGLLPTLEVLNVKRHYSVTGARDARKIASKERVVVSFDFPDEASDAEMNIVMERLRGGLSLRERSRPAKVGERTVLSADPAILTEDGVGNPVLEFSLSVLALKADIVKSMFDKSAPSSEVDFALALKAMWSSPSGCLKPNEHKGFSVY